MKTNKKTVVTNKKNGAISKPQIKSIKRTRPLPQLSKPDYRTQIIVHFQDHVQLPYNMDVSKYINAYNVGPWDQLLKKYPGIIIEPVFANIKVNQLIKWIQKAKEMDPTYKEGNFFKYFRVVCPVISDSNAILEDLSKWNTIKNSYIKTINRTSAIDYSNDGLSGTQGYLNQAPAGIGAKTVWDLNTDGSDGAITVAGAEIRFIDIETGWKLDHADLTGHAASCVFGTPIVTDNAHGTAVLGIVCAKDNDFGCVGIAPNIGSVDVISHNPAGIAPAILESLNYLRFGDILLITATNTELYGGANCKVPVETTDPEYDAIRLATALGIIVVESGGNGNGTTIPVNLNNYKKGGDGGTEEILNPNNTTYFRDSGAIIVTASHSACSLEPGYTNTHAIMPWAPFGNRIDCYAWGENISTLYTDLTGTIDDYISNFEGTSGAAAIIAGAIISMQGMVYANETYKFSPLQIREILRNSDYGTQLIHETGDPFEPVESGFPEIFMPDLEKFKTKLLNLPPDLYLRDFLGDEGLPHSGFISWSPDVINRTSEVTDPQAEYGELNVTNRNRDDLSENATKDQINYLYFRALNQGGAEPTNAKVHAFYSVPSTLITPSLMNYIGETDFPYPIPIGEILTVSNKLEWTPTSATGHYCFVAVVNSDEDPGPDPRNIPDWDWDKYHRYIRENNNVTWKNFDIVEMKKSSTSNVPIEEPGNAPAPDPDPIQEENPVNNNEPTPEQNDLPKKGWLRLDFFSPGLPDRDQRMSLEVISKLPKDVKVLLQVPIAWKKMVFKGSPYVLHNKKRKIGFAPIKSLGESKLENIQFRANSKTPLNLFLHIPDKLKNRNYTIAVRQMLEGKEVGRFTWKLIPPKKREIKPIKKPVKRVK
jgi:serine protease